jgi:hypothetical protein
MKRLFSAKPLAMAAVVLGALVAGDAAQARSDVGLSIGINQPYGYVHSAPVYVAPPPVYVHPRPVYVQPQRIYYDQPRYVERRGPHGDWDMDGVPNRFDRDSRWYDPRVEYRHRGQRDWDRDGVPNRWDRAPGDPYRY